MTVSWKAGDVGGSSEAVRVRTCSFAVGNAFFGFGFWVWGCFVFVCLGFFF